MGLAGTEFTRMIDLLRTLRADEWATDTVCNLWNVRSMVAHVVGMADAQASFRQVRPRFRSRAKAQRWRDDRRPQMRPRYAIEWT